RAARPARALRPRSARSGAGSRRRRSSCLLSAAAEIRVEARDLPPQDPAGVEQVVAHGRLAALQDLGDLARVLVLELAQEERRLLLAREPAGDLLEDARELPVLGEAARLAGRRLLAQADEVERGAVGPLAGPGAPEEVDREVGRDPVEPGVERVGLVV